MWHSGASALEAPASSAARGWAQGTRWSLAAAAVAATGPAEVLSASGDSSLGTIIYTPLAGGSWEVASGFWEAPAGAFGGIDWVELAA